MNSAFNHLRLQHRQQQGASSARRPTSSQAQLQVGLQILSGPHPLLPLPSFRSIAAAAGRLLAWELKAAE